ncbi:MAG TPA: hypothetical protein VHV47_05505 [Opitutaceae bacterium]|jgi:hypothetical protein|nr:hypothetical protein [Opitutaceae bacterium]
MNLRSLFCLGLAASAPLAASAWDYPGHRMVNEVALASLPANFPAWVREPANAERIAYLAGEPDRWRNTQEETFLQSNGMEHYVDIDRLGEAGMDPATLSDFRYDFAAAYARARAAHPENFPAFDAAKDKSHVRPWIGFLPWEIAESYAKLRSEFSYYKAFTDHGGSPAEIANARADIIEAMGEMGHYVGDGSQPLHVTKHDHGWIGPNPNGYGVQYGIHSLIDGRFIAHAQIVPAELLPRVKPAQPADVTPRTDGRDPVFADVIAYLLETRKYTEPLYQLEKAGKFRLDVPASPEGREFIDRRLLAGGEELGALWLTAWEQAAPDTYLISELARRQAPPK